MEPDDKPVDRGTDDDRCRDCDRALRGKRGIHSDLARETHEEPPVEEHKSAECEDRGHQSAEEPRGSESREQCRVHGITIPRMTVLEPDNAA